MRETDNKTAQIIAYTVHYSQAAEACKGIALGAQACTLAGLTITPRATPRQSEMHGATIGCQCRF
jgi:hypothetical protein